MLGLDFIVNADDNWCHTGLSSWPLAEGRTRRVTPVGRLIASYGVHYQEYANDTQLFTKMSVPATAAIGLLQDCAEALRYLLWNNGLLLNSSKSFIVYFGTNDQLRHSLFVCLSKYKYNEAYTI